MQTTLLKNIENTNMMKSSLGLDGPNVDDHPKFSHI